MARIQIGSTVPDSQRRHRTTRDLTIAQRRLVDIMSEHQFGRLENVLVENGEPLLDRSGTLIRISRLGGESADGRVPSADEFELKQAVRNLFDELARLQDGVIVKLAFKWGLPFLLETIAVPRPKPPLGGPTKSEVTKHSKEAAAGREAQVTWNGDAQG